MQKTRQRILDYLEINRSASALEMSHAFGQTPANLRHHLRILENSKLVSVLGERQSVGKGRPEIIFGLGPKQENAGIRNLASQLLKQFLQTNNGNPRMRHIEILAKEFFQLDIDSVGSLTQRLVDTVKIFEIRAYSPAWEATAQGPQIHFQQCPYAEIIDEHPELCLMDKAAIEAVLGEKITQTRKLEKNSEGLAICTFKPKSN